MRFGGFDGRVVVLGLAMALFAPVGAKNADARPKHSAAAAKANTKAIQAGMFNARRGNAGKAYSVARFGRGGLQCVPFARENSGIELSGNANTWWHNAEGVYERGARPEVGSVLNFRANGRMRMGHVAVVANVIDSRNVEIDHANWAGPGASRGGISRNINVVDVSEANDWSAVRVALGQTNDFGSVYPTYGFIYDRPDKGTMVANAGRPAAPAPMLNAPPRDLRPASERFMSQEIVEVAEAEDDTQPRARRAYHGSRSAAKVSLARASSLKPLAGKASSVRATSAHPAAKVSATKAKAAARPRHRA